MIDNLLQEIKKEYEENLNNQSVLIIQEVIDIFKPTIEKLEELKKKYEPTRKCSDCGKVKPESEFYIHGRGVRKKNCNNCFNEKNKVRRKSKIQPEAEDFNNLDAATFLIVKKSPKQEEELKNYNIDPGLLNKINASSCYDEYLHPEKYLKKSVKKNIATALRKPCIWCGKLTSKNTYCSDDCRKAKERTLNQKQDVVENWDEKPAWLQKKEYETKESLDAQLTKGVNISYSTVARSSIDNLNNGPYAVKLPTRNDPPPPSEVRIIKPASVKL